MSHRLLISSPDLPGKSAAPERRAFAGPVAGLALCLLLSSLGTSIANVALPTVATAFGAAFSSVQWVVIAYVLAVTVLSVAVGRLGDALGQRRLLLAGLAVFAGASLVAGTASHLGTLIAARVAQGAGASAMMVLATAMVGKSAAPDRVGRLMGLAGMASALGTALGPAVGGWLISVAGWRSVFLMHGPLALAAVVMVIRYLPRDVSMRKADGGGFDVGGAVLLAMALAAYALSMTLGKVRFGALNVALLVVAVAVAAAFGWVEKNGTSPLIRPDTLRDRGLRAGLGMSLIVSAVVMATLVIGPFYLAGVLRLDASGVGMVLAVGPLMAVAAGVPAGRLVDRWGPRRITMAGLLGMGMGCALLAVLPMSAGVPGYVLPLLSITGGYALFQTANNTAVLSGLAAEKRGVVSGLLNLSRNLGLVTGASLMGAVFAGAAGHRDVASCGPEAIAMGLHAAFAVATALVAVALALSGIGRRPTSEKRAASGQPGGGLAPGRERSHTSPNDGSTNPAV